MPRILVGTSGYSYTEWVGPLYPEGTRSEDFLGLYSRVFSTVELNFSYYKMPTAGQLSGLLSKAGPALAFAVKANEALTHKIDPASWRDAAAAFVSALEPLRTADRLSAVLFQFPYSFHYDPDRRRYLNDVLSAFAGVPLAVEFRNYEWYNNRVVDAFRERRIALASLDLPPLKGLPPVMDVVTSPLAYVRFHGRNGETWWGSDSASRYDYLYSDLELEAWADRVKGIAGQADRTLVYFNNHIRGQAVKNAKTFALMLERAGLLP
jgi:uncharacterized protein YecE (DUF72 family)